MAGNGYRGTVNRSASGEPCLVWADVTTPLLSMLPVVDISEAVNYCRNLLGPVPLAGPSCFVRDKYGNDNLLPCDVTYCRTLGILMLLLNFFLSPLSDRGHCCENDWERSSHAYLGCWNGVPTTV